VTLKDYCIVVGEDGSSSIVSGTQAEVVLWLKENPSNEPRGVYVCELSELMTEASFLMWGEM
jgi:hypothetical protein